MSEVFLPSQAVNNSNATFHFISQRVNISLFIPAAFSPLKNIAASRAVCVFEFVKMTEISPDQTTDLVEVPCVFVTALEEDISPLDTGDNTWRSSRPQNSKREGWCEDSKMPIRLQQNGINLC